MKKDNRRKIKFTVIDLAIILVLIVTLGAVGMKFKKAKVSTPFVAKTDKIQITYYIEEIPEFAATAIKIGDPVKESIQNSSFGKVTDIVIEDSISWLKTNEGKYITTAREGYSSVSLTMEGEGIIGKNGVTIDKSVYYVGQTITIYAGNSILQNGRIADVQKIE